MIQITKQWKIKSCDEETAKKLSEELKVHPLIAKILVSRKIENANDAKQFLNPTLENLANPFLLKDIQKALARIEEAIQKKEKIVIYGDYDVDGTTGSSLLYLFLKELNVEVDVYIPHRVKEGYGLNSDSLRELQKKGTKLVITVDNGISAIEPSKVASELKLDLIIIDHHQIPVILPEALAILNPKQSDCEYPYKELAAVGVAFQVLLALRSYLREKDFFKNRSEPNLKKYLDLVALGTIADVVPLTGQNRILVKSGLQVLAKTENFGIRALKEVSQISAEVTPGQVGFRLGPRINAAGRLHSAKMGFELLTSIDEGQARQLAKNLNEANEERQKIEVETVQHAFKKIDDEEIYKNKKSIFIFHPEWHLGVIGIVASRLAEKYYLPTIVGVLEGETVRCSARSISGLNMYETLKECEAYLKRFGGHSHAAGLTIESKNVDFFWNLFDQKVREKLSENDFIPSIRFDAEISEKIDIEFVEELQKLSPFGQGNPEPVFLMKNCQIMDQRIVGNNHLKLTIKMKETFFEAIGFGMGDFKSENLSFVQLLFTCQINEWQSSRKLQLKLVDIPRALN